MAEIKINKTFRKAVQTAYNAQHKADVALQEVNRLLKHKGFGWNNPNASICAGEDFIVEYIGKEMTIEDAIDKMETRGYLIPEDFI